MMRSSDGNLGQEDGWHAIKRMPMHTKILTGCLFANEDTYGGLSKPTEHRAWQSGDAVVKTSASTSAWRLRRPYLEERGAS